MQLIVGLLIGGFVGIVGFSFLAAGKIQDLTDARDRFEAAYTTAEADKHRALAEVDRLRTMLDKPGETLPIMVPRETMVEVKVSSASVIAAVRSIAKREGVCYQVPCYVCPNLCKGLPAGGNAYKPDPYVAEAARAWLASHGIPVEEAAS